MPSTQAKMINSKLSTLKIDIPVRRHTFDTPYINNSLKSWCAGTWWQYEYSLFSGAWWVSTLLHMSFMKEYKYYIKMDTDIHFFKPAPSLTTLIKMWNYPSIVHTAVHRLRFVGDDVKAGHCSLNIDKATRLYETQYNRNSVSRCFGESHISYFYGNFVIYSTALMMSERTINFADFLYNNYSDGYFKHRWSDQPSITALVCHSLKVSANLEGPNVSYWNGRGRFFEHTHFNRVNR
jgi:hypothetical protein